MTGKSQRNDNTLSSGIMENKPKTGKKMRIELFHASTFGNGAAIADEFRKIMAEKGIEVNVHRIKDANTKKIPSADLYVFASPGRFGKPTWGMRRFLKKMHLPPRSTYALIATELNPLPNRENNKNRPGKENGPCQMVIPIMNEILEDRGYRNIAETKIFVTGMKGPLEGGWREKVRLFAINLDNNYGQYNEKNRLKTKKGVITND